MSGVPGVMNENGDTYPKIQNLDVVDIPMPNTSNNTLPLRPPPDFDSVKIGVEQSNFLMKDTSNGVVENKKGSDVNNLMHIGGTPLPPIVKVNFYTYRMPLRP